MFTWTMLPAPRSRAPSARPVSRPAGWLVRDHLYDSTTAAWTNYGVTDAAGPMPSTSGRQLQAAGPDQHGRLSRHVVRRLELRHRDDRREDESGAETVNITINPEHVDYLGTRQQGRWDDGPLVGSYVTAYEASTATWTNYGVTDAGGAYAINLPAGMPQAAGPDQHRRLSPTRGYGGSTFAARHDLVVDGAETVNIIDDRATSIYSVTVSKAGGAGPLVGSYVTAYEASTAAWTNYGVTDAGGAYAINLPAGSYKRWSRPTPPAIPTRGTAARASPPRRPSWSTGPRPSTSRSPTRHVDLGHRQQGRWSRPAGRLVRDRL